MKRGTVDAEDSSESCKRSKILFQTRCNPKLNFELLAKYKDSRAFLKVITEVGLEGLLNLRITRLQRELCFDLASRLDCKNAVLGVHGQQIPLTYPTVTKVLGLPCVGTNLHINPAATRDDLSPICHRYNLDISGRISMYSLKSYLKGASKVDEEFKVKFVLFTIASLLRPSSNINLHFREFLPFLNEMARLKNFNWAKFVLDGLLEAVSSFQRKGSKSLGGCLLFLQLLYLHCVCLVSWGIHDDCMLATPSLSNWTDKRVNTVAQLAREQGGLDDHKVSVRLFGLSANKLNDISFIPQLLMHQIAIQRMKITEDGREDDVAEMRVNFMKLLKLLNIELETIHHVCLSKCDLGKKDSLQP